MNEIIFRHNPGGVLFAGNTAALRNFSRTICAKTYTEQYGSDEWTKLITNLTRVTEMDVF